MALIDGTIAYVRIGLAYLLPNTKTTVTVIKNTRQWSRVDRAKDNKEKTQQTEVKVEENQALKGTQGLMYTYASAGAGKAVSQLGSAPDQTPGELLMNPRDERFVQTNDGLFIPYVQYRAQKMARNKGYEIK